MQSHDSKVITVLSELERQHLATVIRLVTPISYAHRYKSRPATKPNGVLVALAPGKRVVDKWRMLRC